MTKINEECIGGSLEGFLKEEGIYEEVNARAIKKVIAWQLAQEMERRKITKVEMAARMKTSRSSLGRLLAPDNASVSLLTLAKAASVLGKELRISLA